MGEGRYHRAGEPWPLYASLEPRTVWAEWAAATHGAVDPADERRRLWPIDVDDLAVLDLRRPEVLAALEIDLAGLIGPRTTAQALGPRARELGADGILAPSAADPGRWNLVVLPSGFRRLAPRRPRTLHPAPPNR